jgi:hypothetical protein
VKFGNRIIRIAFIDILCLLIAIAGVGSIFYFEENLFRLIGLCAAFCAIIAFSGSIHHK